MNLIRAELVRTNFMTRWHCHVCGGHTEKNLVLCEVPKSHPTHAGLRVCERCLKSRDFDAKLQAQAAELEAHAAELRRVIGRIDAPSFEDWEHGEALADALWVMAQLHDPDSPFAEAAEDDDVSFEQAIAWPREKQDALIAKAKARYAEHVATARSEVAAWREFEQVI